MELDNTLAGPHAQDGTHLTRAATHPSYHGVIDIPLARFSVHNWYPPRSI